MKKRGVFHAQLICELTKLRHTEKLMICDAGFPVPNGANLVDVSLAEGIPTVEQVLHAVCSEMLFEAIAFPEVFTQLRPELYANILEKFQRQRRECIPNEDWMTFSTAADVKLYVRTGDVLPCSNLILTSASGVPRHFDKFNIEFERI